MSSELLEAFRHSGWANRELLEACGGLDEKQLSASLSTGAGTPLEIMKHVIGAESYYLSLFRGHALEWDWDESRDYSVGQLIAFAGDLATGWEALLTGPLAPEEMLDTSRSRLKAGVLLTQALHHANIHREQVCTVLTSIGVAPPDVSGWAYGRASGGIIPR